MLDLYLIIIPIFGVIPIITLISLKNTLKQPKFSDLKKYQKKIQQNQNLNQVKTQITNSFIQPGYKKTFLYLLKNFTLAEVCLVRRSRNKLPLLLSLSIIAILSVVIKIQYIFCFVGITIIIPFILGKMLTDESQDNAQVSQVVQVYKFPEKVKKQTKFQQKSQVIMVSLSLILNIAFIGLTYKNYNNALLLAAIQNLFITIALDNIIVRPLVFFIFAYPIKNTHFADGFIDKQAEVVQILHQNRVFKKILNAHISAISPRKLQQSPSKVPKAIQIQPRIDNQKKQTYLSTLDLTKSLRKTKLSPINLKKRSQMSQQGQCSLISILHSHQKKKKNQNYNESFDFDKSLFQQKAQQQEAIPQHSIQYSQNNSRKQGQQTRKRNKMHSSKLLMINQDQSIIHNLQNEIQNQEEDEINHNKSTLQQKSLKDSSHRSGYRNVDGLMVSLNKSIEDEQDQQNFKNFEEQQQNDANYQARPHSTLEEDNSILNQGNGVQTSRKNGLLKINEDRNGQDLQQIDLNSPERRKQQLSKIVQDANGQKAKNKKKKGYKKYSLDPNRHVIKHSTGQPYLQFLPNLLNKQRQQKRRKSVQQNSQQVFSRKIDLMNGFTNESRLTKSVKKTKHSKDPIVRQNDQNKIPEFIIEDFE